MFPARLLPVVLCACAAGPLLAQAINDINSLALGADRFATHVMASRGDHKELELFKIVGRNLGVPETLMRKAADIQNWTLIYRVVVQDGHQSKQDQMPTRSLYLRCERGAFTDLDWSPVPVMDCKSMAWRWIPLTLDEAVERLNNSGFDRGFSGLTLMRPMHPAYPDQCTYVFNCPTEQANVGISAQTGEVLWTEVWNKDNQEAKGPRPPGNPRPPADPGALGAPVSPPSSPPGR